MKKLLCFCFINILIISACNKKDVTISTEIQEIKTEIQAMRASFIGLVQSSVDESVKSAVSNAILNSETFDRKVDTDQIKKNIEAAINEIFDEKLENFEKSLTEFIGDKFDDAKKNIDRKFKVSDEKIDELLNTTKTEIEEAISDAKLKLEEHNSDVKKALEKKIDAAVSRLSSKIDQISQQPKAEKPVQSKLSREIKIRMSSDNWGKVRTEDIKKVLISAASEIWKYFPDREIPTIYVFYSKDGPMVWYAKNERKEIVVQLSSRESFYCQYSYQFAHEFSHIMCNYADDKSQENKWFEESVCECASIFALKAMSNSWKTKPPYENWKSYSASLKSYYDNCMKDKERYLPKNTSLKEWFADNEKQLRKDSCQRDMNKKVAQMLFEKLQKKPENWGSFEFLNQGDLDKEKSFTSYLQRWYKAADKKYQSFIYSVAKEFGIKLRK